MQRMRPYKMQLSRRVPLAPNKMATGFTRNILRILANVLLSVGTPGIPGGAIASFAALATMAGLPAGVMGVYISINTLCDMGATCVNVIGDMAGCVVLQEKIDLK